MAMHEGVGSGLGAPPAVFVATSVNGGLRTCVTTGSQTCLWTRCCRFATMGVHPQGRTRIAMFRAQRRASFLESGVKKCLPRVFGRALAHRLTMGSPLPLANQVATNVVMQQRKCEVRPINNRIAKRICKRIAMHVWMPGEAAISTQLTEGVTAPTSGATHRRVPKVIVSSRAAHSGMAALVGQSTHSGERLCTVPG